MTIYTCYPDWDSMLTCIYEASAGKKGYKNIVLKTEPISQFTLFDEYIHVDADPDKARKVMDSIITRISPEMYSRLAYTSMSCESDVLDNIYHVLLLGYHFGPKALYMVQYKDIMRNNEIYTKLCNEEHHFREFIRFHSIPGPAYVAHIEPKSRIVPALGIQFAERMPCENWMIVDDVHREAVVHPKNGECYIRKLTSEEVKQLSVTENANDEYTDLWKIFYNSIAIKERYNEKCRNNLFPLWTRKHAVEFM